MNTKNNRGSRVGVLLTSELLDALRDVFPREPLNVKATERELWFKEGQTSVVEILELKFKEVNKNLLDHKVL